jgi:1,4-dihydroxy-2-naphthoate octaprenyltransferase
MNSANSIHIPPRAVWMLAIRPRTLPASISPVIVGTALAIADKGFKCLPAIGALAGALLLQIGVNLANDYFDSIKGVDTAERLGPIRVTQSGLIEPTRVKGAMIITFGLVALVGIYLITVGGWPVLVMGTASILAALAYSGGPYPLASHGLGDLCVFIFFGFVAVCGTYFVQTHRVTTIILAASVPVGLLITAILVVNNLRDIVTDRTAGKNTLGVLLGRRGARIEYALLLVGAYAAPAVLVALADRVSAAVLLPLLTLPMALPLCRTVFREEGKVLNSALAGTAQLTLLFCLLFSGGLILA